MHLTRTTCTALVTGSNDAGLTKSACGRLQMFLFQKATRIRFTCRLTDEDRSYMSLWNHPSCWELIKNFLFVHLQITVPSVSGGKLTSWIAGITDDSFDVKWTTNWKRQVRARLCGLMSGTIPVFALRDCQKPRTTVSECRDRDSNMLVALPFEHLIGFTVMLLSESIGSGERFNPTPTARTIYALNTTVTLPARNG